jgi:hypothetical protein
MHPGETLRIDGDFLRDGVVCVRAALCPAALQEMEEFFDYVVEHPGPLSKRLYPDDDAAVYTDFFNLNLWSRFRNVYEHSAVPDIIRHLWDCDDIWLFFEQVWWKSGGEARRTPWHQDASYTPIAGRHSAIAWIPLDAVAQEDALEFVRGSHLGPVYATSSFDASEDTATELDVAKIPPLPDIQKDRGSFDIVSWAMEPGDLVVFHFSTLHGGGATHAGGQRRTLSLRYFGPDAVFEPLVEGRKYGNQSRGTGVAPANPNKLNPIAAMLGSLTPGEHYSNGAWPKLGRC